MPSAQIDIPADRIANFCRKWKIRELALFGSVLRDDFRPDSDIDFLVTFDEDSKWDLWDLFEMQWQLEDMFGRAVDFIEKKALHNPFRRASILKTKRTIYEN